MPSINEFMIEIEKMSEEIGSNENIDFSKRKEYKRRIREVLNKFAKICQFIQDFAPQINNGKEAETGKEKTIT